MLRPTGNRVLVRPDVAPDETDSGLVIPDAARRDPEMSGVVVAVGHGPDSAQQVRRAVIARCLSIADEIALEWDEQPVVQAIRTELERYRRQVEDFSPLTVGDTVCFPYTAGQRMTVEGDTLIVLKEDDIVAVWTPDQQAVA